MTTSSDKAECITEFSRSLKGCSIRSTTLSSSYMLLKRMACCTSSIFFGFVWIFPECYSPEVFSSGPHISSAYPTCMQRVKNSEDTDLRHPIGRGQHSVAYSLLPEVGNSLAPKASFNDAHRAQVLKIEIRILCKVGNVPSFPCARLVMYPTFLKITSLLVVRRLRTHGAAYWSACWTDESLNENLRNWARVAHPVVWHARILNTSMEAFEAKRRRTDPGLSQRYTVAATNQSSRQTKTTSCSNSLHDHKENTIR